jgi:hypothetical protein
VPNTSDIRREIIVLSFVERDRLFLSVQAVKLHLSPRPDLTIRRRAPPNDQSAALGNHRRSGGCSPVKGLAAFHPCLKTSAFELRESTREHLKS